MQLTLSIAIIQVTTSCCIHAGFELIFSVTVMLVDLFVAIMLVTVSVTIMQLEVSILLMQVTVSAANIWVKIFSVIMQVGVCYKYAGGIFFSALCTQLFLFYHNYAGDCFCHSYVSDNFK